MRSLSVLLLTVVAAVLSAGTAVAAPTPTPTESAAGWLAGQFTDDHLSTVFSGTAYPDHGLTADGVFALDAAHVAKPVADKAVAWLATAVRDYVGDGTTESYAGAHAKAALAAQAQGVDPTAFGGVDLIKELLALKNANGRFADKSAYGDFSNGISQSFAVIALQRAGGAPADAVDYLAGSECADGGFPLTLGQQPCASDVDTTGYVVQALLGAGRTATTALDWLASAQKTDGGFAGSGPTATENANSTALAATALRMGKRTTQADKAAGYLAGLQVGCSAPAANRGAIAYDGTGFGDTAVRATSQAVLGMSDVDLTTVSAADSSNATPVLDCQTSTSTTTTTATTATAPATTTEAPATTTTTVAPVPQAGVGLANTGADPRPLLWTGGLAVLVGALLVFGARRSRRS